MTQPDHDIPLPEMPDDGPEHARRMEVVLIRRIMTEIEAAAAEVRNDGRIRTVVIRIPGGEEQRFEVPSAIAETVEIEEWAGYGTNWLQEKVRRLVAASKADLSEVHEDEVAIFHIGIVKPADAQAANKAEERVA